jgi:hypothetical protein
MLTASLCFGGDGVGGVGSQLCSLVEISTGPWLVNINIIEKN